MVENKPPTVWLVISYNLTSLIAYKLIKWSVTIFKCFEHIFSLRDISSAVTKIKIVNQLITWTWIYAKWIGQWKWFPVISLFDYLCPSQNQRKQMNIIMILSLLRILKVKAYKCENRTALNLLFTYWMFYYSKEY